MNNPITIGIAAWLVPGAGYWLLERRKRAIVAAAVIWSVFIIAVLSGGLFYPGFEFKDGPLLYLLNGFARLGNGLGWFIGKLLMSSPPKNVAALATFEYGGRFLEVAGLINFLTVIDALDIFRGRKK